MLDKTVSVLWMWSFSARFKYQLYKMEYARGLLSKYGWTEGKGLGRDENGISEALKPKLKFDKAGIGHSQGEEFTNHWWENVFNIAADNINISKTKDGVTVDTNGGDVDITTSKYGVAKLKKNKTLQYGSFLKTSTLTGSREVTESPADLNETSAPATLTDEELFRICGGRTAHKAARHGHKLNGKLARIEAQEKEFLKLITPKELYHETLDIDSNKVLDQAKNVTNIESINERENLAVGFSDVKIKSNKSKNVTEDPNMYFNKSVRESEIVKKKKPKHSKKYTSNKNINDSDSTLEDMDKLNAAFEHSCERKFKKHKINKHALFENPGSLVKTTKENSCENLVTEELLPLCKISEPLTKKSKHKRKTFKESVGLESNVEEVFIPQKKSKRYDCNLKK